MPLKLWKEALEAGKGKLRPVDPSLVLDLVFSLHYERTVKKHGTFSFRGRELKLSHCGGERVTVCLIPNKKLMEVKDGQKVGDFCLLRKKDSPLSTSDFDRTGNIIYVDKWSPDGEIKVILCQKSKRDDSIQGANKPLLPFRALIALPSTSFHGRRALF